MSSWMCNECGKSVPCVLNLVNAPDYISPEHCPVDQNTYNIPPAKWQRVDMKVTDCNQLPKMIKEVVGRPKRPDWMGYENWFYFRGKYAKLSLVYERQNIVMVDFANGNRGQYTLQEVYAEAVEARLRPWRFEEACKYIGTAVVSKEYKNQFLICQVMTEEYVHLGNSETRHSFQVLLNHFELPDGSPCGVYEHFDANREEWVK